MAKCIRCGKPCASSENMCDECKAWFQEKTGGSVVSGVKNIARTPDKEAKPVSKGQNQEQKKEENIEVASQETKPADVPKNGGAVVISKKTLLMIVSVAVIILAVVLVLILKQKDKSDMTDVATVNSYDNNGGTDEDFEPEETESYEDYDEKYDEIDENQETEEKEKISTYQCVNRDVSWYEAEREAEEAGGHLAVITSEEEYNEICDIANASGLTYIWIGAKIDSLSDDWYETGWITGEEWTFDNWYPNEPSRIDTTDDEEELYLCMWNAKYNDSEIGWTFNDQRNDIVGAFPSISGKVGYIIEFEE